MPTAEAVSFPPFPWSVSLLWTLSNLFSYSFDKFRLFHPVQHSPELPAQSVLQRALVFPITCGAEAVAEGSD